jgi:hypothetical protein
MRTWTACEALSWGMFGDETQPLCSIVGAGTNLPARHRTNDIARRELRSAIAQGVVEARGFRVNHNQPPLAREPLIRDLFDQFPALAVDAFGETVLMHPASPQNIPQWNGIIFVEDEIRALWPKPRPPPRVHHASRRRGGCVAARRAGAEKPSVSYRHIRDRSARAECS